MIEEPEAEDVIDRSVLFKDKDAIGELARKLLQASGDGGDVEEFAADVLKMSNMGVKQFEHFDAGSIKELDLMKSVGHLSQKQKLLLTYYAEIACKMDEVMKTNRNKVARCLVGAECIRRGVVSKATNNDVLL